MSAQKALEQKSAPSLHYAGKSINCGSELDVAGDFPGLWPQTDFHVYNRAFDYCLDSVIGVHQGISISFLTPNRSMLLFSHIRALRIPLTGTAMKFFLKRLAGGR